MSDRPRVMSVGSTPTTPAGPSRPEASRLSTRTSLLAPLLGVTLALVAVTLFVLLDYRFAQAPHRLVKLLAGGAALATILFRPRFGLFLIPIATPFLPWVPPLKVPGLNLLNVMLGSVFVTWALTRVLRREPVFRAGRLSMPLGLITLVAAISIFRGAAFPTGYQYDVVDSSIQLFRGAVTLSVYFIVLAMARGPRDRRLLAWAIVIGLLAEAVVTILYGRSGSGQRALGSIGQSNDLGAFLAIYTAFAASLLVGVRRMGAQLLLGVTVLAGAFGVVLSVSRAGILALATAVALVALRSSRVLSFILVATVLTSPWWAPDFLKERILGTQVEMTGSDGMGLEGAAQVRVDTWRAIVKLVVEHPLDGVGFAGLQYVLPETGDALGIEVKDSAHNTFLRFLGEMGVLGLVLFMWLLWRCWTLAMQGMRVARNRFDRQLALGLAGATVALAISCMAGDRFFNILVSGNFWFLCALVDDLVQEPKQEVA